MFTKRFQFFVALIVILGGHAFIYSRMKRELAAEPDTYFVLGLARDAAHGIVRSLPQFEDLGWGKHFVDKNFLFTASTGAAYRFGGEDGVKFVLSIFAALMLIGVFFIGKRYVPVSVAVLGVLLLLLDPLLTSRLYKLRPHVFGMAAYMWLLYGILSRRPWLTLVAAAVYCSGYHMFLIPAVVLAAAAFSFGTKEEKNRKLIFWGAAGVILGVVVNPYFPANIRVASVMLGQAVNSLQIPNMDRPMENIPFQTSVFLQRFGFYMVLLSTVFLIRAFPGFFKKFKLDVIETNLDTEYGKELFLLALLTIFFWVLTGIQPRTSEYATPTTVCLVIASLSRMGSIRWASFEVSVLALLMLGPRALSIYRDGFPNTFDPAPVFAAIDSIPQEATGKKVFNCEWTAAPYVYYRRPDLRVVDVLDPSNLAIASPTLNELRNLFREGLVADSFSVIRGSFGADYVFCKDPSVSSRLDKNPYFKRLYPPDPNFLDQPTMFEVATSRLPNEVLHFEVSAATGEGWKEWELPSDIQAFRESSYADLKLQRFLLHLPPPSPSNDCRQIRPAVDEIKKHVGSTLVAVGGGPLIQLWWNETPLLSVKGASEPSAFRRFVNLPRALSSTDRIKAVVCTKTANMYHGFSMSFWKGTEIENICKTRQKSVSVPNFEYVSELQENCMAPIARRAINSPFLSNLTP